MSKPTANEGTGSYSLKWPDGVSIDVSRVREHRSDGSVKGEVAVRFGENGNANLLHRAQFNFSSTQARNTLAKELESRVKHVDWKDVLEQTCYYVVDWLRQGDAPQLICTAQNYQRPTPLIDPIVLRNQPTVLFGEGESAKSLFVGVLALVMILPWKNNPLGLTCTESVIPLVLDWETAGDEYGWRLGRITRGMGLPDVEVPYRRCALSLADDIERISKLVAEHKAGCIIVDSIAGAAGGDINTAETAIRMFTALRQLNTSSILVAHTSKDENRKPSIFGSVFFTNYARQVWLVKKESADDDDHIRIGLFHKKHNNTKPSPPLGFQFDFNPDDSVTISRADIRDSVDMAREFSASSRILHTLKLGAQKPATLAEDLSLPASSVRVHLVRLKKKGLVVALDDGRYGLPVFSNAT
jgi:DNA-binding transcriptional ArsR family regulator